jgi:hypothetical protein
VTPGKQVHSRRIKAVRYVNAFGGLAARTFRRWQRPISLAQGRDAYCRSPRWAGMTRWVWMQPRNAGMAPRKRLAESGEEEGDVVCVTYGWVQHLVEDGVRDSVEGAVG